MPGVEKRSFDSPDESRTPDKTRSDIVHMGGTAAARLTLDPGWRWSDCVKPVAGTESCQHKHVGRFAFNELRGDLRIQADFDASFSHLNFQALDQPVHATFLDFVGKRAAIGGDQARAFHRQVEHLPALIGFFHFIVHRDGRFEYLGLQAPNDRAGFPIDPAQ